METMKVSVFQWKKGTIWSQKNMAIGVEEMPLEESSFSNFPHVQGIGGKNIVQQGAETC